MIAVLAGTLLDFENFVWNQRINIAVSRNYPPTVITAAGTEYRYVDGKEDIAGLVFHDMIVVGLFWDRKDAYELFQIALTRILKEK
jgi:hypothetical protein